MKRKGTHDWGFKPTVKEETTRPADKRPVIRCRSCSGTGMDSTYDTFTGSFVDHTCVVCMGGGNYACPNENCKCETAENCPQGHESPDQWTPVTHKFKTTSKIIRGRINAQDLMIKKFVDAFIGKRRK